MPEWLKCGSRRALRPLPQLALHGRYLRGKRRAGECGEVVPVVDVDVLVVLDYEGVEGFGEGPDHRVELLLQLDLRLSDARVRLVERPDVLHLDAPGPRIFETPATEFDASGSQKAHVGQIVRSAHPLGELRERRHRTFHVAVRGRKELRPGNGLFQAND